MEIAIFCDKGFEDACREELRLLTGVEGTTKHGYVAASVTDADILKLYYRMQSALRIICDTDTPEAFQLPSWIDSTKTFRVATSGFPDNRQTAAALGSRIDLTADLDNPDILIFATPEVCGVDLAQLDLAKREYRIYTNPAMLRSTFAFSLLLHAGFQPSENLLDPFCGSGTIPIEAALHAHGISPRRFRKHDLQIARSGFMASDEVQRRLTELDEKSSTKGLIQGYDHVFQRIQASCHNAKIAGVLDNVDFARMSVDWIDTRNDRGSVDRIVTHPPLFSKKSNDKKVYQHLFRQADFVLSQNGTLTITTNEKDTVLRLAEGWHLIEHRECHMGQGKLDVIRLGRKVL